ncbi:hypothetical protein ACFOTA_24340 [Chitinophaga sp. GCM10012297]|uniref:Uncharacterized protein n=1 Tax=Chitinophaga chungangae TaxID=2821488 RepID=A0ABS3YM81_9BACT|nr:hypothetical protein [Chitinophaga chungangae]MBO9155363.1 hypothetical protein [Chitinophaga chungangae]
MADDFLKQLGISRTDANNKITGSLLDGYLDGSDVKNIKNIALGNRTAITKDLLAYTKQYLGSAAFIKEYNALREREKPAIPVLLTPEEMQQGIIDNAKKSIADMEDKLQKADASTKPMYEKILATVRKQLQQAEDPANRSAAGYRNAYPDMVKNNNILHQQRIAEWEKKYPANHQLFVKQRLLQFLDETKDIDFSAGLYEKNGIKYFTNPGYERKNDRWKMAFRAGESVVVPARSFVQKWMQSLP